MPQHVPGSGAHQYLPQCLLYGDGQIQGVTRQGRARIRDARRLESPPGSPCLSQALA